MRTCLAGSAVQPLSADGRQKINKITKSAAEWREALAPEQYQVTRKHDTERTFTGEYWNNHEKGMCCGKTLFDSSAKNDSDTSWLSYSMTERLVSWALPCGLSKVKARKAATIVRHIIRKKVST